MRLLGFELNFEDKRLARAHRFRYPHLTNGLIVDVSVVRLNVSEGIGDIRLDLTFHHPDALHIRITVVALLRQSQIPPLFFGIRTAVILPGIMIEMKWKLLLSLTSRVLPVKRLRSGDDVGFRIELHVHRVMHHAIALRREFQILVPWFASLNQLRNEWIGKLLHRRVLTGWEADKRDNNNDGSKYESVFQN